jgi:hypothetical protein
VEQWLKPVIPASLEVEIRRIEVQSPPRQKVRETLSPQTNNPGMVLHAYNPSYTGVVGRRILV